VVTPTRRHWQFRYVRQGRDRLMSLGNAYVITLAGARDLHLKARAKLAEGIDPLDERARARAPRQAPKAPPPMPPFKDAARDYIVAHEPSWRSKQHRWQWRQTIEDIAGPVLGEMPVDTIGTDHVLAVLQPIWHDKPETASRLRGRIEVILDYAKVRGWRSGENPARWRGHLSHLLASPTKLRLVRHHAALPWRECPEFMARLSAMENSMGALALAFAILTAARSGEVRLATWHEIDLATRLWTVPAARMKAGREHRVPLSEAACALVAPPAAYRQGALVFPGQGGPATPLSDMTLTAVLRRMGRGDLTAHGFRSTFRDWCAENGYPHHEAELALAHSNGNATTSAYLRTDLLDQRRGLMDAWAAFLTQPPADYLRAG
jgi:integrase